MTVTWIHLLLAAAAYLAGSIPFALLLSRLKGVDIRTVGSGNVGATNVFRSVSKGLGVATFACDALKGLLPALLFPRLAAAWVGHAEGSGFGLVCGCAAIAGHNWPVFLRFKGGKGVATSAGVLLGVAPAAVGIGLAAWFLLFLSTRYVSVASIGAAVAVPAASWFLYRTGGPFVPAVLTALGALIIWRHRANLSRLAAGTEHRFDFKRKPGSAS